MIRRGVSDSLEAFIRGRPYKKRNTPIAFHAAQRPAESSDVDFNELGLTYEMTNKPELKIPKFYWTTPPESPPTNLPFHVERTSVSSGLPIYTDYKGGRTKVITILRKCRGDINELKKEMQKVCDGREVNIRPGKLVVDGNYHIRLKRWLSGLGF